MQAKPKSPALAIVFFLVGVILIAGTIITLLILRVSDSERVVEGPFQVVERVNVKDAKLAFDAGKAVFVDVRGDEFYAKDHIPGALSIPLGELEARIGELKLNDWIILYCT